MWRESPTRKRPIVSVAVRETLPVAENADALFSLLPILLFPAPFYPSNDLNRSSGSPAPPID